MLWLLLLVLLLSVPVCGASSAVSQPSWIVQILFGRYESDVSSISWTEVIVLAVIGVVMVYVYLFFLRLKFHSFTRRVQSIPRAYLPLTQRELGRRMYSSLIHHMVRVDDILRRGLKPAATVRGGDPGWGLEGSRFFDVHFNTSIAKSFILLENTALSRRPGLKHNAWRTTRHYVQQLRKAFPGLKQALCDDYIHMHEKAVFSDHKFTFDGADARTVQQCSSSSYCQLTRASPCAARVRGRCPHGRVLGVHDRPPCTAHSAASHLPLRPPRRRSPPPLPLLLSLASGYAAVLPLAAAVPALTPRQPHTDVFPLSLSVSSPLLPRPWG